ncbi:MAG: LysR family transcriptional regulator substrate-binding protein [Oscillospiraceae bacterium]|nr:LysR family transcriptional regulator substrate-binding protein [Oscillospiraceae bacterium]
MRVAACRGAISEFGAEALREFEALNKNIRIQMREYNDKLVDNVILRDDAMIGFGLEPMDTELFHCERVHTSKYVLLINENDPLASYDVIPTSLLPGLSLITVDETFKSAEKFLCICSELGYDITPALRVGEITAVHRLVRRNMGVGLSIDTVAEELATPGTVYRPFDSDLFSRSIDIFIRKSVSLPKPARDFFDFIVNRK